MRATRFATLFVAITALMLGLLVPALGNQDADKTCKDLAAYTENLEGNESGEWGSIEFSPDDGPLVLNVTEGWTVNLCIKKGAEASNQGPIEAPGSPFVGPVEDLEVDYPGAVSSEGFSHYAFTFAPTPEQAQTCADFFPEADFPDLEVDSEEEAAQLCFDDEVEALTCADFFPDADFPDLEVGSEEEAAELCFDDEVEGAVLSGSLDAECIEGDENGDALVTGSVESTNTPTVLAELQRDGETVDSTDLEGDDEADLTDVLAADDTADYSLLIDGNEVDSAMFENDCLEVLGIVDRSPPTGDVEVLGETLERPAGDVEVLGESMERPTGVQAGSGGLATTGMPAFLVALMALGAMMAGTGTLTAVRRRR
jgi:hypothetical protein